MDIKIDLDAKETFKHIIKKFSSGRWILTVICGGVFAWVSIRKIIPPDAVIAIISMVFISYFNRDKNKDNGK